MRLRVLTLLLICSIVMNAIWLISIYRGAIKTWFVYQFLGKPHVEVTFFKNPFPKMLFEDGYHYIYWVESNEINTSSFSSYTTPNGYEYVDLGLISDK